MTKRGGLRLLALAPLAVDLTGCVAAAIPMLAGTVLARKEATRGDPPPPPKPAPAKPIVEVLPSDYSLPAPGTQPAPPPGLNPTLAIAPLPSPPLDPPPAELVPVAQAVPAPVAPAPPRIPLVSDGAAGSYAAFAAFAIGQAPPPAAGKVRHSALVDQDSITSEPRLTDCTDAPPAVVIDLDHGDKPFDLADAPRPAPGLAEELARVRAAGITVLWSASLPVDAAPKLYTVLRASGLDPDRTDRLLLLRNPDERKQLRRAAAARDWCIVAIAGDARGDFDELYDYLRDPTGPLAAALAPTFGTGWFLVPPPID